MFDKTGTITSEELIAEGYTGLLPLTDSLNPRDTNHTVQILAFGSAPLSLQYVLAGCHTLVSSEHGMRMLSFCTSVQKTNTYYLCVGSRVAGDPLEMSSLNAIGWKFNDTTCTSVSSHNISNRVKIEKVYLLQLQYVKVFAVFLFHTTLA
jgi:magnesium-transporting ATPase (P-type)